MAYTRSEQLTDNFYAWEKRGRGWHLSQFPIELEPAFKSFSHQQAVEDNVADDSKRYNTFAYFTESIRNAFKPGKNSIDTSAIKSPPAGNAFDCADALCAFSVSMPLEEKPNTEEICRFLVMLSYSKAHISFEIIATSAAIRTQFVCREPDTMHLQSQLKAYFPECIIQPQLHSITGLVNEKINCCAVDFGLQQEFMRPIAMPARFDVDPLTGVFGILEHLEPGEQAVIQILFKGAVNPWAENILCSVTDNTGDSFFLNAPEMPKLAAEKISVPLYGVVIRALVQSITPEKAGGLLNRISGALIQSTRSASNSLIELPGNNYEPGQLAQDILHRHSHRCGMLLNSNERKHPVKCILRMA